MVNEQFRRGTATPRRSRRAYYTQKRRHRLGATTTGTGFRIISPHFMRRVKNRPALRHRGYVHAMIRPIVAVALLCGLGFGAHYGYQRALTSPALSIQSVRLHQVPNMLIEPVRARLKPAYGENLLALDLVALRASIEELPAVRTAGVRRVLPDGLVVSVEARQPKVRVSGERNEYVIDREGVVLDTYDQRAATLPEIRLVDGGSLEAAPGRRLTADPRHGAALLSAMAVVDWLAGAGDEIGEPVNHIRVGGAGIVLVAAPGRLEIVVGDERRMAAKMTAVRSLLRANRPTEPSTIDARYTDILVVRALDSETD